MSDAVRCMIMRGGTSKGAFFVETDLPTDVSERDQLLMRIMGTPDPRQIDGLGGAHPLTSKVAIASISDDDDVDIEYLFLQIGVEEAFVTDRQNCGNLLSAIGPFAVERGLVTVPDGEASIRIRMRNTGGVALSHFQVGDGKPVYDGDTVVSGVPGTAGAIAIDFLDIAGGTTGALLPTGNTVDEVEGIEVTMVDNGMPVVVMLASDLGKTGHESCADLEADPGLRERLEQVRLASGVLMGLGDVTDATIPKLTMVAPPGAGGDVSTRTFIPHRCHDAIGVLGAVSVATACLLPGTPAHRVAEIDSPVITLEHPTGTFDARVEMEGDEVRRAGIVRTARKIMDGFVYPRSH
ncbi:MAG TPA: 4-oxalomesaconate tautomerase [Acidimicrobiia bacterium]|nr:4-oxalomesaconate tautomerase [Acidimicrobiia bacterium]